MFTQLSLFDSAASIDTVPCTSGFVHVSPARCAAGERSHAAEPCHRAEQASLLERVSVADPRRADEIRPMGELAQLVLARYDLLARRRQEMDRRRREQPRKSIRVLSPQPMGAR